MTGFKGHCGVVTPTCYPNKMADGTEETLQCGGEETPRGNSPRLSRKAREDAVAVNEPSGGDPDNYLLNSSWTFWHDA